MLLLAALALDRRPGTLTALGWALVPAATLLLIGLAAPLFWARYLLFTVPAWVLLAALALSRLPLLAGRPGRSAGRGAGRADPGRPSGPGRARARHGRRRRDHRGR